MYKSVRRLKHYDDNLRGSVVMNEILVQQVPVCRPGHNVSSLLQDSDYPCYLILDSLAPFAILPVPFATTTAQTVA